MVAWRLAIDFGTSNSAAARRSGDGVDAISLSHQGNLMPSAVFAEGSEFVVGHAALNQAEADPEGFLPEPKRAIGSDSVRLGGQTREVSAVIGAVLKNIVERASRHYDGRPPADVVLTHPEAWDRQELKRLVEAAEAAGIDRRRLSLVSEPRAATYWYSASRRLGPGRKAAVFDLGGGTLDIAVLTPAANGSMRVIAARGDNSLGGRTLDARIRTWVESELEENDTEMLRKLREGGVAAALALDKSIREAKEVLSEAPKATITVAALGHETTIQLTRGEFEELIAPDVARAVDATRATLLDAGVSPGSDTPLYLTGGSSRIPYIQDKLGELCRVATLDDPKTVVCRGALLGPTRRADDVLKGVTSWVKPGNVARPRPGGPRPRPGSGGRPGSAGRPGAAGSGAAARPRPGAAGGPGAPGARAMGPKPPPAQGPRRPGAPQRPRPAPPVAPGAGPVAGPKPPPSGPQRARPAGQSGQGRPGGPGGSSGPSGPGGSQGAKPAPAAQRPRPNQARPAASRPATRPSAPRPAARPAPSRSAATRPASAAGSASSAGSGNSGKKPGNSLAIAVGILAAIAVVVLVAVGVGLGLRSASGSGDGVGGLTVSADWPEDRPSDSQEIIDLMSANLPPELSSNVISCNEGGALYKAGDISESLPAYSCGYSLGFGTDNGFRDFRLFDHETALNAAADSGPQYEEVHSDGPVRVYLEEESTFSTFMYVDEDSGYVYVSGMFSGSDRAHDFLTAEGLI